MKTEQAAFPFKSLSLRRQRISAREFLVELRDLFFAGQFLARLLQFFAAEIAVSI